MFDLSVRSHFSAGHHLRDYPGNCENPHGHNWKVEVTVRATRLDKLGMAIDFRTVKEALKNVLLELDHKNLNELPAFLTFNPSSENIAVHVFDRLKDELIASDRYQLHCITIYETDDNGVSYFGV